MIIYALIMYFEVLCNYGQPAKIFCFRLKYLRYSIRDVRMA